MEELEIWPGRQQGNEEKWRQSIRNWDVAFHQWMQGLIDDDEAWNAYEEFNIILQDHYLENELAAKPEFPRYGTKNIRDEEQFFSCRGYFLQHAIRSIDEGEGFGADDVVTFRRVMYNRAIKKKADSKSWVGGFSDVDYSVIQSPTCHLRLG